MENKIIVWDWDGVIVDSIGYKYEGIWDDVFKDDIEKQQIVKDFIQTKEGKLVNRYGLIQHTLVKAESIELENLTGEELKDHPLMKKYAAAYKTSAIEGVIHIGLFPSIKNTLKKLHEQNIPMYVVSGGGNNSDLRYMAEKLSIDQYFKEFFGIGDPKLPLASFSKYENFKKVEELEKTTNASRYVVIGDGISDYDLATEIGCFFVGIDTQWNEWSQDEQMMPYLRTREEIFTAIDSTDLQRTS